MNPYTDILRLKKQQLTPAQEAITHAFLELYKVKTFSAINVTELCNKAHVARTTFYASYSNTDALLAEIEDALIVDLLKVNKNFHHMKDLEKESECYSKNAIRFMRANYEPLYALLIVQPDVRLIDKWKQAVKYHFWDSVSDRVKQMNVDLVLEMIASMAVGGYTYMLKTGKASEYASMPDNMQEVSQAIYSALTLLN